MVSDRSADLSVRGGRGPHSEGAGWSNTERKSVPGGGPADGRPGLPQNFSAVPRQAQEIEDRLPRGEGPQQPEWGEPQDVEVVRPNGRHLRPPSGEPGEGEWLGHGDVFVSGYRKW